MDSGIDSTESSNGSEEEGAAVVGEVAMEGQPQQEGSSGSGLASSEIALVESVNCDSSVTCTSVSDIAAGPAGAGSSMQFDVENNASVPIFTLGNAQRAKSWLGSFSNTPTTTTKPIPSPLRTLAASAVNDIPSETLENRKNNNGIGLYTFSLPAMSTPPITTTHSLQITENSRLQLHFKIGGGEEDTNSHEGDGDDDDGDGHKNSSSFDLEPLPGLTFANVSPSMCLSRGYEAYSQGYAVLPYENNSLHKKLRTLRLKMKHQQYKVVCPRAKERKLFIGVSLNNLGNVEQLLKDGVSPRISDNKDRSPLHIAASKGYTDIAKLLLQYGADPNQKDAIGNTALHLAACTSHIPTVTLLLKAGTNVRQADNQGYSPLHLARTKLKLIQRDNNASSKDIKKQVHQVIEMMQTFLECSGSQEEADLFTSFTSQLTLSDSRQEVESELSALLSSLNNLSLVPNT